MSVETIDLNKLLNGNSLYSKTFLFLADLVILCICSNRATTSLYSDFYLMDWACFVCKCIRHLPICQFYAGACLVSRFFSDFLVNVFFHFIELIVKLSWALYILLFSTHCCTHDIVRVDNEYPFCLFISLSFSAWINVTLWCNYKETFRVQFLWCLLMILTLLNWT